MHTISKEEIPDKYFSRFWKYVTKTRGCWYWKGSKNQKGYGMFRVLDKRFLAHRFSYLIYNNKIPNGAIILHTCDNPACVNPKHLMYGSASDNSKDSIFKKRNCRGSEKWSAKLNEIQVKYIRQHTEILASKIAKDFNVTKTTIYDIRNRKIWRHI